MLPIDLVLVRHGQSEGNAANRLSEAGDDSAFTDAFRNRHSSSFRLTEKGREQAILAGRFIRKEFMGKGTVFDRYITSEYFRAMETAGLLSLPKARWYPEFYLRERDWGKLDICPPSEREKKYGQAMAGHKVEPFFWSPPNGESLAQLCLRIDRVLHTLHRECSDKRVIIVCHGEVMRAFQVRLERLSQAHFKKLLFSDRPEDRIHNCQVTHYTRRNPYTGKLMGHAGWVRWIRPAENPVAESGWKEIQRKAYSNKELLDLVNG